MRVRYRYRLYPAPGQQQALARVFGCARVVYNDCLRLRDACHGAGEKISDTEVQRRVITLAKLTPERSWLSEVASVALVQACQDARRAYRNWFDSLSGKRKGRKVGHPKPRRKHGRQSIRLTRNGFARHGQGRDPGGSRSAGPRPCTNSRPPGCTVPAMMAAASARCARGSDCSVRISTTRSNARLQPPGSRKRSAAW